MPLDPPEPESLPEHFMRLAHGDLGLALVLACTALSNASNAASNGYLRAKPAYPTLAIKKRAEALTP